MVVESITTTTVVDAARGVLEYFYREGKRDIILVSMLVAESDLTDPG